MTYILDLHDVLLIEKHLQDLRLTPDHFDFVRMQGILVDHFKCAEALVALFLYLSFFTLYIIDCELSLQRGDTFFDRLD